MVESRKATDVLLEIESKVSTLLNIISVQDLNIKVLSNKLSEAISLLKQQTTAPKFVVETVQIPLPASFTSMPIDDQERHIPITAESKLPQTDVPQGFRRNSRPETYAGDNAYLSQAPTKQVDTPSEIIVPPDTEYKKNITPPTSKPQPTLLPTQGQIPVMQRCVDKNGKSIFLADVEVMDLSTGQSIVKTRTNGTGKWMTALAIGNYRVVIRKRESLTKEKLEAVEDVQVDGKTTPLELNMIIIKGDK